MDELTQTLLMTALEDIKKQNQAQIDLLHAHMKDDSAVKAVVERHSTYFKLIGVGLMPVVAYVASKLGLK
ncbi:MAG: hypothetical protein ACRCZI_10060 [Cetobacterium sp.]